MPLEEIAILKSVVEIFAAKLYSLHDVVAVSYPIQSKHTTILVLILMRLYTRLLYRASYQGSTGCVSCMGYLFDSQFECTCVVCYLPQRLMVLLNSAQLQPKSNSTGKQ